MTHVVVIGAGIIGVSTGLWLRRAGFDVTLIDKGTPGMGASYGNGCILASCSVVPVTGPGLVKNAPKMLRDPNFPLFLTLAISAEIGAMVGAVSGTRKYR